MDLRKIKKLIELLEESALTEMEITEGENTIRLSRTATQPIITPPTITKTPPAATDISTSPPAGQVTTPAGHIVESPLVGTFYDSPSPDEKPFVTVDKSVAVGDTLCLIEAMKTFNRIEAERAGTITAIHKSNGDPVEYGESLFVIAPRD